MNNILKLMRPYQWVKNVFVFIPLFFGGQLTEMDQLLNSIIMFVAFCLAASSIYCFNDIIDVEADRNHYAKRNRPIASGAVSIKQAYVVMFALIAVSIAILWFLLSDVNALMIVAFYWLLQVAYCAILKRQAIIDVTILAFGFVLRIIAGGIAADVTVSKWLVLMTFLLTLFLGFAKRRDDVLLYNKDGKSPRYNTRRYNLTFLNQALTICGSVMLVCYIMYTVSPEVMAKFGSHYIYLTSIYVLLGLLRYIQLTVVDEKSGDPTKMLLHDRFIRLDVLAWLLTFLFLIYK
ncbi:MAG: decaprenyl-phosphate phosphoribosyltransferase [Prevotella sp.]|nr:decaprenyl-phosphate phosphoribosyltransferase [Prevotella sp.]